MHLYPVLADESVCAETTLSKDVSAGFMRAEDTSSGNSPCPQVCGNVTMVCMCVRLKRAVNDIAWYPKRVEMTPLLTPLRQLSTPLLNYLH